MTGELPHRRKALPLSQSILWAPGSAAPAPDVGAYQVFLHQRALNALHDHLRSSPDNGVMGFLLGHLYEDPPSGQKFAVIELVMRLTVAIYGDKTTVVVSRVWDKMQEELTRSGAQLLGWYHSHPPGGVELAPGDLETHATYFGQPWQSALVIGQKPDGAQGGLYRPRGDGSDAGVPLPFYELLDPRSVTPDGKKRSSVRWTNYRPHRPPAGVTVSRSGPVPAVPDAPPPTLSFKPTTPPPDVPTPAAPPQPPPPPPPPPRASGTVPRPPQPQRPISADMVPAGDTSAMIQPITPRTPPPPPPPRHDAPVTGARRRSSRPQPRFILADAPPRRSRVGPVLFVLALLAAGAGGAWYFLLGPGAGATSEGEGALPHAVGPGAPDSAAAPAPDTVRRPAAPDPARDSTPAAVITPVGPPPVPLVNAMGSIDRLADTLGGAIRGYQERARLFAGGLADCTVLARGLVAVEGTWTTYEAEKRRLTVQLDESRAQRDLGMFGSVDSVSAHYDRSGCRRP